MKLPIILQNASRKPAVYYGLHMASGIAEYNDPEFKGRVLVPDETIKRMNPTAAGCPLYVRHVNEVNLSNLEQEADGYVTESFFNPMDGKHWIKFTVVSDKGHEAKSKGWTLSNAYFIKSAAPGGTHQGVQYDKEVVEGEYDHFAMVDNPRYEQSIILTPEEFKSYNEGLENDLKRLANSKETPVLNLFRKKQPEKVENSADIETLSVKLKSGTEKTIMQLVNEAETAEEEAKEKAENGAMAEGEGYCMVGEEKMKVNELVEKHSKLMQEFAELKGFHDALKAEHQKLKDAAPAEDEAAKKKAEELAAHEAAEIEKQKAANEEADPAHKAMNEHFDSLKNAPAVAAAAAQGEGNDEVAYESMAHQVARGKSRYGS